MAVISTDENFSAWRHARPELDSVSVGLCDLHGLFRAKRLPISQLEKVMKAEIRLPQSAYTFDIWGADIEGSELVFESGDKDGVCQPILELPLERSWTTPPSAFVPVSLRDENGAPLGVDPRQALIACIKRFTQRGLSPVCAVELEFYLTPLKAQGQYRDSPYGGDTLGGLPKSHLLLLDEVDAYGSFLADVYEACALQNIPVDAAISEGGIGQFEINLQHEDALRAADHAVLLKAVIKGVARKYGFNASFMAKPFGAQAGSGLHVHMSLQDACGVNVFDDGTEFGSDVLRYAVRGLLDALPQSMLIFAPYLNSYRRFQPNTHAPLSATWGYENRTCAVRIPAGPHAARRIEHRVAGADANPYLVLSALLGAIFQGLEAQVVADPADEGNVAVLSGARLPYEWGAAIEAFESGDMLKEVFDPMMIRLFSQMKYQERAKLLSVVSNVEYHSYFDVL